MFALKNGHKLFYATEDAIGFDIQSGEDCVIESGGHKAISTGLFVDVAGNKERKNEGLYELQIRPRSGLAFKFGVTVLNAPGTIDPSYPDEIKVILINHGRAPFTVSKGDRIAQGVVAPVARALGVEVKDAARTGGFGSTGVKA